MGTGLGEGKTLKTDLERDGLRQVMLPEKLHLYMCYPYRSRDKKNEVLAVKVKAIDEIVIRTRLAESTSHADNTYASNTWYN